LYPSRERRKKVRWVRRRASCRKCQCSSSLGNLNLNSGQDPIFYDQKENKWDIRKPYALIYLNTSKALHGIYDNYNICIPTWQHRKVIKVECTHTKKKMKNRQAMHVRYTQYSKRNNQTFTVLGN
jgi:hypothetical protein